MNEDQNPLFLRPNTFFCILIGRAGVPELLKRADYAKGNDGITQTNLLRDLLRIADPSYQPYTARTLTDYLSRFKKGTKIKRSEVLPFSSQDFRDKFAERMNSSYDDALTKTIKLTHRYLQYKDEGKRISLVKTLMDIISRDKSLKDESICIDSSNTVVKCSDILSVDHIVLEPFLLSIWHLLVTKYFDCTEAANTFEIMHVKPETTHDKWFFDCALGKGIQRDIEVTFIDAVDSRKKDEKKAASPSFINEAENAAEREYEDVSCVLFKGAATNAANPATNQTVNIFNGPNFFNQGSGDIIYNTGTLYHSKKKGDD